MPKRTHLKLILPRIKMQTAVIIIPKAILPARIHIDLVIIFYFLFSLVFNT